VRPGAQRAGGDCQRGLALLKTGDEVLIPDNAYGPNKALAEGELAAWGITHQLYDPMDPADLASAHHPAHQAGLAGSAWLGDAGVSRRWPTMRMCRQKGVSDALDNTWGAGLAFNGVRPGPGARFQPGSGGHRRCRP
jgi:cystathionine beta-lyase